MTDYVQEGGHITVPALVASLAGDLDYFDAATKLIMSDDETRANPRVGVAVTAAVNPTGTVNVRVDR